MRNQIETRGFAVVNGVLSELETQNWREITAQIEGDGVSRRQSVFAIRNLLDHPEICDLARSPEIRALIEPILGPHCFAVRGIFFDKTPDANWKVPFHQDLSIAVAEKIEVEGFGPWSEKAGTLHVQPPAGVLEKMLTIRLHLDACDAQSGALRVAPGSHRLGNWTPPKSRGKRAKKSKARRLKAAARWGCGLCCSTLRRPRGRRTGA